MIRVLLAICICFVASPVWCASKYWVGGGSSTNWNATANTNWSDTDGGANNATIPANGDDVFLKSAANCKINVATANLKSFNMTGYTGTLSGASDLIVSPPTGNTVTVAFAGTITWTGQLALEPVGTAIINFYTNNKTLGAIFDSGYLAFNTGTVNQQDALACSTLEIYSNYNANGFSITASIYVQTNDTHTRALNITNSTISCNGATAFPWYVLATGLTLTTTGSTINITDASATAKSFVGGAKSYNTVTFSGDNITISGNNTFITMTVNTAGRTNGLKITATSTQTVTNFNTNGSSGSLAVLQSSSAGSAGILSKSSGTVSVDYMSIKDSTATGGATWYAGSHSTNVSGNSGWSFSDPVIPDTTGCKINYAEIENANLGGSRY